MAHNVVFDLPDKAFKVKYMFKHDSFIVEFAQGGSLVITITDNLSLAPTINYRAKCGWLSVIGVVEVELFDTEGEISFCKLVYAIAEKHGLEL